MYAFGSWNVTDVREYRNCTIIMEGNITIKSGGNLTLHNVTLLMNNSSTKQWKIDVWDGGAMYVLDWDNDNTTRYDASNITVTDIAYTFLFLVRENANFIMKNSELHRCGTGLWVIEPPAPTNAYKGLFIQTDNAIVGNNNISNNRYGIVLYGSNALISNNTIEWCDTGVMATAWSNGTIENNVITQSKTYGIWVDGVDNSNPKGSNPIIRKNIITESGRGEFTANAFQVLFYSNPIISDNIIINCTEDGIYLGQWCQAYLSNNSFEIGGGNYGIASSGPRTVPIINCSIKNTDMFDLSLSDAYFFLTNTSFNKTKVKFWNSNTDLTVNWYLHTKITDSFGKIVPNANVRIRDNSNGTFDQNFTTDSNGHLNWTVLKEFYQNKSTKFDFSPYNITVSKPGYFDSFAEITMNKSKYIAIALQEDDNTIMIPLEKGWNLISIPTNESDSSIENLFSPIDGLFDQVQYYDNVQEKWLTWNTDSPVWLNTLHEIKPEMGVWIHLEENAYLPLYGDIWNEPIPIHLEKGWNLIGYPSLEKRTINEVFTGISWDMVQMSNQSWDYNLVYLPGYWKMVPGRGYWVHVTMEGQLVF